MWKLWWKSSSSHTEKWQRKLEVKTKTKQKPKNCHRYFSGSAKKGKGCSKILKTPKNFCKIVYFSLMLQAFILEFPASTKQTPRKTFPVSVLK